MSSLISSREANDMREANLRPLVAATDRIVREISDIIRMAAMRGQTSTSVDLSTLVAGVTVMALSPSIVMDTVCIVLRGLGFQCDPVGVSLLQLSWAQPLQGGRPSSSSARPRQIQKRGL